MQGSRFLKFLLDAAPEHYHSEAFHKVPLYPGNLWGRFGPAFFTTVFVSRLCSESIMIMFKVQYNDPSIQMIEADYLVNNSSKSVMYQVEISDSLGFPVLSWLLFGSTRDLDLF